MKYYRTHVEVAALPAGIPRQVQLLDHDWLTLQRAGGAMLTLVTPQDGEDEAAELTQRIRALEERLEEEAKRARERAEATEAELRSAAETLDLVMAETERLRSVNAAKELKFRDLNTMVASSQLELMQLRWALALAQRPALKKILGRK